MDKNIRLKIAIKVIGVSVFTFFCAIAIVVPTIRWEYEKIFDRAWYLCSVALIFSVIGTIRIMLRLRPLEKFREMVQNGEPVDKETLEKARHMALLFPISGSIIAPSFIVGGGIVIGIGMIIKYGSPISQVLLLILNIVALAAFIAVFVFFIIKRSMVPVVERLMIEDPDFLNAKPPVKLSIRAKLTYCFVSLGVLMAMFVLLGNTLISDAVYKMVGDPAAQKHILESVRFVFVMNLALAIVSAVLIGLLASGDLSQPIKLIAQAAEGISRGEGAQKIPIITEDEVGDLASNINRMSFGLLENMSGALEKAETLLVTIREASNSLRDSSWEISSISSQQASNATRQSTTAQQVSSASIEISQSSRQIAASAAQVYGMADEANSSCEQGQKLLDSTLADIRIAKEHANNAGYVIKQMSERSHEIRAIVDIIEEISTQINLLSVNAALEAVGAGAAGKRFGTVAHEVGRLADKTAEAIERVRKIISESAEFTDKAVEVMNESSKVAITGAEKAASLEESFNTIRKSIEGTVGAAKEIELTTNQQATSSDQMVDAISSIAESSKELEDTSKRLDKNIENLAMLTDRLKEMSSGN